MNLDAVLESWFILHTYIASIYCSGRGIWKLTPPPHHVKALECYNYILLIRWFSIIMVLAQTINILSLLLLSIYMMVGSSLIHLSVYLHPFFPLVLLSLLFLGCGAQFTQTVSCAANLSNQYMAAIFIGMVGFFFGEAPISLNKSIF